MCEWLTYGEWCDVKLLCGGRAFNAHRAVLASVSTFLRRMLLSCPVDESPTYIVLPDFDLESMSTVLYYIYNGEAVIPKQKLGMFLDIIKAMQIFIDCEYLQIIRDEIEENNFELNTCSEIKSKTNIFSLGFGDYKHQRYINLKKGKEIEGINLQYSQSESCLHDNTERCHNRSEPGSYLGNPKSPYGDRQKNSFLRDLFIETYPRNGNVNGRTASVLAISNEYYQSPASVLSTNANGVHLSTDDTLSKLYKKTSQPTFHSPTIFHPGKQLQRIRNNNQNYGETQPRNCSDSSCINLCSSKFNSMTLSNENREDDSKKCRKNYISTEHTSTFLPLGLRERNVLPGTQVPSLDLSITQSILDSMSPCQISNRSTQGAAENSLFLKFSENNEKNRMEVDANYAAKVIYNQVLENPWSPRRPNNYKPYRRKMQNVQMPDRKNNEIDAINDRNNNIQNTALSIVPEDMIKTINDTKELKTSDFVAAIAKGEELKCTVCNQVFASNDSLTVHMRRHSTCVRYTCGECGKTFSQLRNFKYHMSIHRGTREFAATCTVCGKYFNDRGYLSSHMKIHRNRKEYKCSQCPKSFNQRVAYNMHVRIHTGVKPHVCEECGKAFSRKMLLKQHQRTHSGERPYACPHCEKRFADRSNMTLHLRLHTGVKPFSCSLCPKSFTKKHHLKSHLNFHTGSKPYSCPRCSLAFTQSSNMRTHMKKCNVPEPTLPLDTESSSQIETPTYF